MNIWKQKGGRGVFGFVGAALLSTTGLHGALSDEHGTTRHASIRHAAGPALAASAHKTVSDIVNQALYGSAPESGLASRDWLSGPSRRVASRVPALAENRRKGGLACAPAATPDDAYATPATQDPLPAPAPGEVDTTETDTGIEGAVVKPEGSPRAAELPMESTGLLDNGTQAVANDVPLATNPELADAFSEFDLAQVESPLFLSAAINEFDERPLLITSKWSVKPHLSVGAFYDGNIFLRSRGNEQGNFITRIAPGITMRLGDTDSMFYMVGDYTAGFNIYTQRTGESTVDQDARAQLQWTMPKTVIGINLGVSADTGQDVDVSDRVQRQLYYAGITTHYTFGEKTSWDVDADYTRNDYNGLISSSQEEGQIFFNYEYSPKTLLGVGVSGGYLDVPGSGGQTFEGVNLRATYRATGKLTVIGEVGGEVRQYSGRGETTTPVFSVRGAYVPRVGTEIDLTLQRRIYASAILQDQDYTATSVDLDVRQRITKYVDVSFSAGYVNADYTATRSDVDASREDNYFYVRPAVQWRALSWMSVGIFYEYSQDLSNGSFTNGYTRDRGGVDVAILF